MAEQYKPMTQNIKLRNNIAKWKTEQARLRRTWIDYDLKIQNAYYQLEGGRQVAKCSRESLKCD
jgi:hypothetical protein